MQADSFLQVVRESHSDIRNSMIRTGKEGPANAVLEDQLDEDTLGKLAALRDKLKE